MEGYEVEHEFPGIGSRTMCLNARQSVLPGAAGATILLGMEDVTQRRNLEREKDDLLQQKKHCSRRYSIELPIACRIIASIILMKARARCSSKETRFHPGRRAQGICLVDSSCAETTACRREQPEQSKLHLTCQ